MDILFRVLVLGLIVAASFFLATPLMINILLKVGVLAQTTPESMKEMMSLSTFVWLGAIVPGILSLFIKQSWRVILLVCPLILPLIFVAVYALTQS